MDKLNIGTFDSSAYSPHDDKNGLNSWKPSSRSEGYRVRTRTGTIPKHGTIAVDPKVIPLGSRVYIEGIGWRVAEDVGGKIRNNRIDVVTASRAEAYAVTREKVRVIWQSQ